jgi:hypothetical protein
MSLCCVILHFAQVSISAYTPQNNTHVWTSMDIFVVEAYLYLSIFLHDTYLKGDNFLLGIDTCVEVTTIHLQTYC